MKHLNFDLTVGGRIGELNVDLDDVIVVSVNKPLNPKLKDILKGKIKSLFGDEQKVYLSNEAYNGVEEIEGQTKLF